MKLLIDLGNSRLKWALWQEAAFIQQGEHQHAGLDLQVVMTAAWQNQPAPQQVIVTSVADKDKTRLLQAWCEAHWQVPVTVVRSDVAGYGIRTAYQQAQTLGSDRWLAMVAAFRQVGDVVCVIDCGTAITLDIVDQGGQHLGGYIMPGLSMMRRSLSLGTASADITHHDTGQETELSPGTDTAACLNNGCLMAAVGLIESSVKRLKQQHGDKLHCMISGGDATALLPLLDGTFELVPDLVLQGLAIIAAADS